MRSLFALVVLLFSFKSMAHTCHISLYDPYNRPYLNFYSENDLNCQAAAQRCYQAISYNRLNPYHYKCYTISIANDPEALPQTQAPSRSSESRSRNVISPADQDYRRQLSLGESVYYQGKYGVVTNFSENGLYEFLEQGKKKRDIEKNIDRKDLAITRGCLRDICTKTSYISKSSQKYVSIEGIDYNGRYIVQDIVSKENTFEVEFYDLAKTSGCIEASRGKICVGNTVLGQEQRLYNRYYEVAGIQSDRMLVLKDDNERLLFNIDANAVMLTR